MNAKAMSLALLSLCFVCCGATAQSLLSKPVDFSCASCTPAEALVNLSRETGINIVFNDRFFQKCPPITIEARDETLGRVLDKISLCAKVGYRFIENQIVFSRKNIRYNLSGYILDADSGERLIGAGIRLLPEKTKGAVSNEFGFFNISLEEGQYSLQVQYVGYLNKVIHLDITGDRMIKVHLKTDNSLPEVIISALPAYETEQVERGSGERRNTLSLKRLHTMPVPGGEADLLRLAALQPGVQTGVDGLGGLHIRGGNADQNLILLDDVPVYNPGHALGLFSIFNPSTVSNAQLWKGDFPARYGGRTSSVLDVRTRDGNFKDYKTSASAGLFASSVLAEGPILQDKCSFLFGGRGTYFGPWARLLSRRESIFESASDRLSYRFYDINAKLNYIFSEKNRLYINYYQGGDKFQDRFFQEYTNGRSYTRDDYRLASNWGNSIASLRWNRLIGRKLFTNTTFRYSRFNYQSRLGFNSTTFTSGRRKVNADYGQLYQTYIRDLSLKTDFTFYAANAVTLRWGVSHTNHDFRPGALSVNFLLPGQPSNVIDSLANLLGNNESLAAGESEAYIDADVKLFQNWRVMGGLNGNWFRVGKTNYHAYLPRIRVQHNGRGGWSQWAAYTQMTQNLHQIGSFNVSLPFELWVPSTDKVKPEKAWQATLGGGWRAGGWEWSVEAYYKRLDRVLSFLSANDPLNAGGAEDASGWEDRIAGGSGWSRGIEAVVEKTMGSISGSIAYTWSQAERHFADINSGRPFPFRFDRRHDFKIALKQRLFRWLDLDVAWYYASGTPITLAGVKYTHHSPEGERKREVYVYSQVNGYRLPPYHRLDIAFNAQWGAPSAQHFIQLGAYNVYDRGNPFFIFVDAGSGNRGRALQYTLFPLLPAFRYEIKF